MKARYNKIPQKLRAEIANDLYYKSCALYGQGEHICGGRITLEHALIYAGRRLQEKYAIIPLCARGHEVDEWQDAHTMRKDMNVWVALNRATDEDLMKLSKVIDYRRLRTILNQKYGPYISKAPRSVSEDKINYGRLLSSVVE